MILALSLLIVACARPRESFGNERKNVEAIAVAIAVDISGSMCALDLAPEGEKPSKDVTRLGVVKKMFEKFVKERPNDLISLVTFGTYASARTPLTNDHRSLLQVLKTLQLYS